MEPYHIKAMEANVETLKSLIKLIDEGIVKDNKYQISLAVEQIENVNGFIRAVLREDVIYQYEIKKIQEEKET